MVLLGISCLIIKYSAMIGVWNFERIVSSKTTVVPIVAFDYEGRV